MAGLLGCTIVKLIKYKTNNNAMCQGRFDASTIETAQSCVAVDVVHATQVVLFCAISISQKQKI